MLLNPRPLPSTIDRLVAFTANLAVGRTTVQSWWLDERGERLAGTYYASIERIL